MKSVSVALVKKNDICNMFLFGSRHSFFILFIISVILKRTIARRRNVMTAQKAPRAGLRAIAVSIMFDLFFTI